MKKILLIVLVFGLFSQFGKAQITIGCGSYQASIDAIICVDDVLSFTVTAPNGCTSHINTLPPGSSIDGLGFVSEMGDAIYYEYATFYAPSPGCASITFEITQVAQSGSNGCDIMCPAQQIELIPNLAQIPTLGQWGLMALGIVLLTFGVVKMKTLQEQKSFVG